MGFPGPRKAKCRGPEAIIDVTFAGKLTLAQLKLSEQGDMGQGWRHHGSPERVYAKEVT